MYQLSKGLILLKAFPGQGAMQAEPGIRELLQADIENNALPYFTTSSRLIFNEPVKLRRT
jgi:hypothetical protein